MTILSKSEPFQRKDSIRSPGNVGEAIGSGQTFPEANSNQPSHA
ncbi:hypothetical protein [Roseofilum casamattae]|uniref:Uncharacterized protein n=1 Tax=Roseofilum casamattae BLCC-M143 TaxID=3022442 RepID=A0ABT7BWT8_9CYAN|nr:hypothetical protein [Roseofilum casamattae]MDJ1182738.1 hypothetical protein [Roseofilum casamattae BLCC-M143]